MDDNIIYYLVLGAIYVISRVLKKKKPKPGTPQQQDTEDSRSYDTKTQNQPPQPAKPSSFEELLKEISQEFTDKRDPEPKIAVVEEPTVEIEHKEREKTREEKYVARKQAEAAELARKTELTRLLEEENEHESHGALELLQEEDGAANAIILSEILTKKY